MVEKPAGEEPCERIRSLKKSGDEFAQQDIQGSGAIFLKKQIDSKILLGKIREVLDSR